jgi:hypothetical protein
MTSMYRRQREKANRLMYPMILPRLINQATHLIVVPFAFAHTLTSEYLKTFKEVFRAPR